MRTSETGLEVDLPEGFSVMPWEAVNPAFYWEVIDNFVVADRHLPDGTRQHVVRGSVEPGHVVRNAQVLGAADLGYLEIARAV